MYRIKNVTSGTWVENVLPDGLFETMDRSRARLFEKAEAKRTAKMLSDDEVKYRSVRKYR